ncbi:GTP-binding protein [Treponema primitia]|uniref:GTP-binding protein n=1 Tax=Treponema primitia TaxID=88058 RepID=UPI000255500C|nr:GTP-binding protein [Treponema primitia]
MRLVTFAGPPSAGKTSAAIKTAEVLLKEGFTVGAVKFDCISTTDDELYRKKGIPVLTGISGNFCPDHYFITNIEDCISWGVSRNLDFLFSESAGLCNRCSPHIKGVRSLCVIDCLSGVNTPKKIGPMLLFADMVIITKADVVSQAEREVFAFRAREANRNARFLFVNGLTGEGAFELARFLRDAPEIATLNHSEIRFPLPSALCSYCLGETRIGPDYATNSMIARKIEIPADGEAHV